MTDNAKVINRIYNGTYWSVLIPMLTGYCGIAIFGVILANVLGPMALANMGLLMPISLIFSVFGSICSYGGVLTCSQLTGKGEHRKARAACTTAFAAEILISLIIAVFGIIFLHPILTLLQIPAGAMYEEAYICALIIFISGIFTGTNATLIGLLRLNGLNKEVTIFNIISMAIVFGSLLFFLVVMDSGVEGLFISMGIGGVLSNAGMLVAFLARKPSVTFGRVKIREFFELTWCTIRNGFVSATDEIVLLFATPLLNALIIGTYGLPALMAYSIYSRVDGIFLGLATANAQGITMLLGVFSGERDSVSSKTILRTALKRGIFTSVPAAIVIIVFARQFASVFGLSDEPEALMLAIPLLMLAAIKIPLAMFNNLSINVHNAFGNLVISNILNAGRIGLFLLPAVYILSAWFGVMGVWHAFWVCEAVTMLVALGYSFIRSKRNKNLSRVWLIDREYELKGKYMSFSCGPVQEDIVRCAEEVGVFCHANCLVSSRSILISLAVEEMLTLIASHAEIKENDFMDTRVVVYEDEVIIRIRNGGKEFNPLDYYYLGKDVENKFAVDETIDEMLALGDKLGIRMVKNSARNIDYRRTFGVNNLTVTL